MNATDITRIIEKELSENKTYFNPHNVDLEKSILHPPIKKVFRNSFNAYRAIEVWLVMVEDLINDDGYKIIYDEKERQFGLAVNYTFIGYSGSFLETLARL